MTEPTVTLTLPPTVYDQLRQRAHEHQRRLEDEATLILTVAIGSGAGNDDRAEAEAFGARILEDIAEWLDTPIAAVRPLLGFPTNESERWPEPALRRLEDVHRTIAHLHAAAGRDSRRVAALLTLRHGPDTPTVAEHLASGRFDQAYLVAIDALRPVRDAGMVQGRRPQPMTDATVAVFDED